MEHLGRRFLIVFVPTVVTVLGGGLFWSLDFFTRYALVAAVAILFLPLFVAGALLLLAWKILGDQVNLIVPFPLSEARPKSIGDYLFGVTLV